MYWDDEMDDDRIEKIKHTLVVGRSSSHCGNCGREAFMGKSHDILAGYAHNGEPGCKIEFKYVASGYVGLFDDAKINLEKMTGLEYWDMYGLQTEPEKKAFDLDDKLKLLERKREELLNLEIKTRVMRRERDKLALEIIDTEKISIRQVAKHAGVSNVRLVQLRKARKKNVAIKNSIHKSNGNS